MPSTWRRGFRSFGACRDQASGAGGDRGRYQPVRDYVGGEESAGRDRAADEVMAGRGGRSRQAGDGVLRLDGGDDLDPAGGVQPERRGGDLRTVLRELWAGCGSQRSKAAVREAASAAGCGGGVDL